MEDAVLVQVDQGLEDLIEEALGLIRSQWIISALSHEFLEIVLEVLENQVKLVLRIDYFLQPVKTGQTNCNQLTQRCKGALCP